MFRSFWPRQIPIFFNFGQKTFWQYQVPFILGLLVNCRSNAATLVFQQMVVQEILHFASGLWSICHFPPCRPQASLSIQRHSHPALILVLGKLGPGAIELPHRADHARKTAAALLHETEIEEIIGDAFVA